MLGTASNYPLTSNSLPLPLSHSLLLSLTPSLSNPLTLSLSLSLALSSTPPYYILLSILE